MKMYTNEAGFDVFQQALKTDALNSGLTFMADSGNRYMQGEGQHITYVGTPGEITWAKASKLYSHK